MLASFNLRWRFALSNAIVIILAMCITGLIAVQKLNEQSRKQLSNTLTNKISLLKEIITPQLNSEVNAPNESLDSSLRRLDRAIGARLTVISADGQVVSDSRRRASELDNHGERPEVLEAVGRGSGHATRFSTSVGHEMIYVAQAVDNESFSGILRIAYPLRDLDERRAGLIRSILVASLVGLLIAILLGIYTAGHISSPLQRISEAATAYGEGDYSQRVAVDSQRKDAFANLGRTFNALAEELEHRLTIITDERNRLQAVLSALNEGVIAVDRSSQVVLLNQPAAQLLDLSLPAPRAPLWELCRNPDILNATEAVLQDGQRRQLSIALFNRHRPNQEIAVEVHTTTFNDEYGQAAGAVMVLHDVSDRRLLETMRRDFVANVSHELKTPLAAIRGLVETVLDDPEMPRDTRQRFVEKISDQCLRLTSIVMDLLTLSRAEARHDAHQREAFDLASIVRMSIKQLEAHALVRHISITYQESDKPLAVRGDPELLRQAIDNLIDNAIKYSPDRSTVQVSLQRQGDLVHCAIADSGIGIPKQHLDRIWERFYRVDKARSREVGGTGLGLSIVRNVISSHGGTVLVQSESGRGSTFSFTLPLGNDAQTETEAAQQAP